MKKKRLASLLPCRLLPCLSSHPTHSRRPDLNPPPPPPPPSTSLSPPHLGPGSSRRGGAPRPTTAAADSQPCPRRSGPRSARIWLPSSPPTGWERLGHARLPRPAATVGDAACRRARPRAVTGRACRGGGRRRRAALCLSGEGSEAVRREVVQIRSSMYMSSTAVPIP